MGSLGQLRWTKQLTARETLVLTASPSNVIRIVPVETMVHILQSVDDFVFKSVFKVLSY